MTQQPSAHIAETWPIVGHAWAVDLLHRNAAPEQGALSALRHHAYLLLGPRHIGKTTLARVFAQALLCQDPVSRPCGGCRSCRRMARGSHPDFSLIQPLDKEGVVDRLDGTLRVEQAAELVRNAALRPVEGKRKVFLIQDAHTANDNFANRLLKTLEEPPPHLTLCLTAVDRTQLLPTIVSRCQSLELRPLRPDVIQRALESTWGVESAQADLLARLAAGRLGWAVRQLTDETVLRQRSDRLDTLWRLVAANRVERLAFAEQLAAERTSEELFGMLELWIAWWRDIMLMQSGCGEACRNIDHVAQIARQAQATPSSEVRRYLHTLRRLETYLHHTVNTRLALDVLLLRLPAMPMVASSGASR